MKDLTGTLSFKVPEDSTHVDAGKKIEKEFEYQECETVEEATKVAEGEEAAGLTKPEVIWVWT